MHSILNSIQEESLFRSLFIFFFFFRKWNWSFEKRDLSAFNLRQEESPTCIEFEKIPFFCLIRSHSYSMCLHAPPRDSNSFLLSFILFLQLVSTDVNQLFVFFNSRPQYSLTNDLDRIGRFFVRLFFSKLNRVCKTFFSTFSSINFWFLILIAKRLMTMSSMRFQAFLNNGEAWILWSINAAPIKKASKREKEKNNEDMKIKKTSQYLFSRIVETQKFSSLASKKGTNKQKLWQETEEERQETFTNTNYTLFQQSHGFLDSIFRAADIFKLADFRILASSITLFTSLAVMYCGSLLRITSSALKYEFELFIWWLGNWSYWSSPLRITSSALA